MSRIQRILEELTLLGITWEEFQTFKYAGGERGSHANYFNIAYPNIKRPMHKDKCICGKKGLVENCYVVKDGIFIVLGNCCIKKYVPQSGRTCEDCGESHKNRTTNKCNECKKKKRCLDCNVLITRRYHTRCLVCHINYDKDI